MESTERSAVHFGPTAEQIVVVSNELVDGTIAYVAAGPVAEVSSDLLVESVFEMSAFDSESLVEHFENRRFEMGDCCYCERRLD